MRSLFAYVLVALVFGITPGPDVVLVVRGSLAHGTRHGVLVALGAASGSLAWGMAAAFGLAGLVAASPVAYAVLHYAGAVYLVVLGVQTIRAVRHADASATEDATGASLNSSPGSGSGHLPATGVRRAFLTGLWADLLNPKMGAFYLAMLPQFIPVNASVVGWSLLLMVVELSIAVLALSSYVLVASRARVLVSNPTVARSLDTGLGVVLIGTGAAVAVK